MAGCVSDRSSRRQRWRGSDHQSQEKQPMSLSDTHISLAHGNGGRFMRELITEIFARHLANPDLDTSADAVPLNTGSEEILSPSTAPETIWPWPAPRPAT